MTFQENCFVTNLVEKFLFAKSHYDNLEDAANPLCIEIFVLADVSVIIPFRSSVSHQEFVCENLVSICLSIYLPDAILPTDQLSLVGCNRTTRADR